jgi:parallel beta-helix repeat protein
MKTRLAFCLSLCAITGCNNAPADADFYVTPGGDDQTAIQTAFIEAEDGNLVHLGSGTFTLTDALEVSGLDGFTLRGEGPDRTILDFSDQTTGGDAITMMNMTNVTVENLSIIDPPGDGLVITGSDGVVVRSVSVGWSQAAREENGKYAIYPTLSSNVLVEDSETYGSSDAGFYIGQVTNCIMRNNRAHGNVAAYEVENSVNCEVTGNIAEDNVGGILVFELPGLPNYGTGTLVADNQVLHNNVDNFAEEGSIVALLPRGTGIFVLAGNDVEVRDNTITDNEGTGMAIVSWGTAAALGEGGTLPPDYDPWAEDIWVHDNVFMNNGGMPGGDGSNPNDPLWQVRALLGAVSVDISNGVEDILWDGLLDEGATPDTLCIQNNGDASFRNLDILDLAVGSAETMTTTDLAPHDCAGTARPPVVLE